MRQKKTQQRTTGGEGRRVTARPLTADQPGGKPPVDKTSEEARVQGADELFAEAQRAVASGEPSAYQRFLSDAARASTGTLAVVLERIAREVGERTVPLLEKAADNANAGLAVAAVDALGLIPSDQSASALTTIAESAASREVRKVAKRSLFRLRSKGLATAVRATRPVPEPIIRSQPIVFSAFASQIDGHGDRLIALGVETTGGGIESISLMVNELSGIVECSATPIGRRRFLASQEELLAQDFPIWVEIPPQYARQLLHEAYEENLTRQAGAPVDFLRWQKVITEPEGITRPIIYDEISLLEIKWNPQLLDESPQILRERGTQGWILSKEETDTYIERITGATAKSLLVSPWTERERAERADAAAREEIFDAERRGALKRRLEETAYIFLHTGRPLHAKRAIAAAISLQDSSVSLSTNPFISALLQESVSYVQMDEERRVREEHRHGQIYLP